MEGLFVPLASGQRVTSGTGGTDLATAARPPERRARSVLRRTPLPEQGPADAPRHRRGRRTAVEWGLGLLTRLPIREIHAESLGRLPREKVKRALIVATLEDDGRPFYVLAVHGAHLSHGSYRQYRRVSEIVDRLDPSLPILLGGDFNSWRPLLRVLLPGLAVPGERAHVAGAHPALPDRPPLGARSLGEPRRLRQ